jgi:hypothetical protein
LNNEGGAYDDEIEMINKLFKQYDDLQGGDSSWKRIVYMVDLYELLEDRKKKKKP